MLKQQEFDSKPSVRRRTKLPSNPETTSSGQVVGRGNFPSWLHRPLPKGSKLWQTHRVLSDKTLNTVCEECKCPNLLECYSKKTATYLAMGKECTRACGFCDIDFDKAPKPLDPTEPSRLAQSAVELGLKHVVVTMVTRDDLSDGGAAHIAAIIRELRETVEGCTIEVLTSDFSGNTAAWDLVLQAKPDILNHNIETVERMTPRVRHKATYQRSLQLLSYAKEHSTHSLVKSGIMVGLGETDAELRETLRDLQQVGCDIVTMGQYLQPNRKKLQVKRFVSPEDFETFAEYGRSIGIGHMYCGPFVRSSYNAREVMENLQA